MTLSRQVGRGGPIAQAGETGVPLFALSVGELPPGEYFAQPFFGVYTRFERADGQVLWLPMDRWEGQDRRH